MLRRFVSGMLLETGDSSRLRVQLMNTWDASDKALSARPVMHVCTCLSRREWSAVRLCSVVTCASPRPGR